ncbi:MAG: hypothetical protein ABI618_19720, partial [Nitrospirota bacterium]
MRHAIPVVRPEPRGRAERTEEFLSTIKQRSACTFARRAYSAEATASATKAGSASAGKRIAAGNTVGMPAVARLSRGGISHHSYFKFIFISRYSLKHPIGRMAPQNGFSHFKA